MPKKFTVDDILLRAPIVADKVKKNRRELAAQRADATATDSPKKKARATVDADRLERDAEADDSAAQASYQDVAKGNVLSGIHGNAMAERARVRRDSVQTETQERAKDARALRGAGIKPKGK